MNLSELLAPGSIGEDIILAIVMLATFANLYIFYRLMLVKDPLASRVKHLNERREQLRAGIVTPRKRAKTEQREKQLGIMRNIVGRFNLLRSREARKAQHRLSQAGYRSKDALTIFYFLKLCLPFVFGVVAVIMVFGLGIPKGATLLVKAGIALGAVVAGAYMPDIMVKNQAQKRQQVMHKALPDALDLLVICAEAGQSLDGALNRVSAEVGQTCPTLAEELSLTAIELGLLPERRQAFENLNNRTNTPGIRAVVQTLLQTEKYGTPVAQSLRVLSAEFRNDRMMKAEEKAAKLPAVMTVPLILFILPPLFIVLLAPAVFKVMDTMGGMTR